MSQPSFYGEHLNSIYSQDQNGVPVRKQHSSPQSQHLPQQPYPAPAQSTHNQPMQGKLSQFSRRLPHGWNPPPRETPAPPPSASRRPTPHDAFHSTSSSISSSSSGYYGQSQFNSGPSYAPPPPPGAAATAAAGPLSTDFNRSPPPQHDYFAAPAGPPSSPALPSQQPYQSQYRSASLSASGGGGASRSGSAGERDSFVSSFIGAYSGYGDLSPGSTASFGSRNGSPSPQPSPALGAPNLSPSPAAYQSFSQAAYPPTQATYAPNAPPPPHRTQSASAGPPRQPAYQQQAPPAHSSSFAGYPSTTTQDQFASYPASGSNMSQYARPELPRPPVQQSFRQPPPVPSQPLGEQRQKPRGDSLGQHPPPSDAFYISDTDRHREVERQRVVASQRTATESSSGEWASATIPEHHAAPYHQYQQQPTTPRSFSSQQPSMVLTTPPLGATRSTSQRTESLSSVNSTSSYPSSQASTSYHTTLASSISSTSTTRFGNGSGASVNRNGTLSPNTSFGGSLLRADSAGSPASDHFDDTDYLNVALLSNIAVWFKDNVPQGNRTKGALEHPNCFTGEEVVTTILSRLPSGQERRYAVTIARSLQRSLWFHEVDWADTFNEHGVYTFEGQDTDEVPTGVLTSLTPCLSPYCAKLTAEGNPTACYSYSCPNSARNQLRRQGSQLSAHSTAEQPEQPDNWVTFVGKAVADATGKMEVKRQLNIFELIDGEEKYLNDLELVRKNFVEPLVAANPPIIAPERMAGFLQSILLNVDEIRTHSRELLTALKARQAKNPVVSGVGDILLEAALNWGPAYLAYLTEYPMAAVCLSEEEASNPRFKDHVMDFSRSSPLARVGFKSFQSRPTFRLLRYILLLQDIYKHTENNDEDRSAAEQAISVIQQQSKEANLGVSVTEGKVKCREYHFGLQTKNGEPYMSDFDLDLLHEGRKHFVSSKIVSKSSTAAGLEAWSEGFWILFDHYLVQAKPGRSDTTAKKFTISRRGAIPLEFLQITRTSFSEPPEPRGNRFHIGVQRTLTDGASGAHAGGAGQDSTLLYPITLTRIGRNEGRLTFYVESEALRKDWATKLAAAVEEHRTAQEKTRVVALVPLAEQTFGCASTIGSLVPSAPADKMMGNPTCSAPLTAADGQPLIVAGCAQGLFIGFRDKPQTMRQVVHLAGITQCAILPEFGFILVVAQKVLIAYSLEALVPSGGGSDQASKTPQRLSGSKDVLFMRVGKVGDVDPRTLVIYVKKSGVKESVFKALEPVSTADRTRAAGRHGFLGIGASKNPEWFRTYKDFFLPSFVYSFRFLRSKLAIVCAKGVEIMNLESLRTMSVPDFSHQHDEFSQKLAKRCAEHKTLGMFRLQDNLFLLVYNAFSFHVDKHGEPLLRPVGVIEWESNPEQVAFQSPHIYAFSSKMIEIRNAFTGRLAQVIVGRDIALTYDGDGIDSGIVDVRRGPALREEDHPDRRLHVSMRIEPYHVLHEIRPLFAR